MEKAPSMKMRKNGVIEFMKNHNIIPEPIPTKLVLLGLIREANVPKQYIIDNIAKPSGCSVLRLPPYHCMLDPTEMVWSQIKQHCQRQNIYTNEPSKVLDLMREVCSTKISPKIWESSVSHVIKEEEKFRAFVPRLTKFTAVDLITYNIFSQVFAVHPNFLNLVFGFKNIKNFVFHFVHHWRLLL